MLAGMRWMRDAPLCLGNPSGVSGGGSSAAMKLEHQASMHRLRGPEPAGKWERLQLKWCLGCVLPAPLAEL